MILSSLSSLLCLTSIAYAYFKGFNLAANLPSGECKTEKDWTQDFETLKSLPGLFNSVRLYAASDCDTLANAVPAALAAGVTLLAGVWTEDEAHFNAELAALLASIRSNGTDWLIGVSVGSEDLYRKDANPVRLAEQIESVKESLQSAGAGSIQVGHVDTWNAWVDPANNAVIIASDFVGTDQYPYFQNKSIEDGYDVFWQSVKNVQNVVQAVKPNTAIWIAETGWPVSGETMGAAYPSRDNAQTFWNSVACSAFGRMDTFWYILQDYRSKPSFGLVDADFEPLFDLTCD